MYYPAESGDEYGFDDRLKRSPITGTEFKAQREMSSTSLIVIVVLTVVFVGIVLGLMFGFNSSHYTF